MVKAVGFSPGELDFIPASATALLCGGGQVALTNHSHVLQFLVAHLRSPRYDWQK